MLLKEVHFVQSSQNLEIVARYYDRKNETNTSASLNVMLLILTTKVSVASASYFDVFYI
eukprot:m.591915 g.591915  ORF g.591915 m.591915 type:complete len:59 (-) comp22388_c0_seq1:94-270(-)